MRSERDDLLEAATLKAQDISPRSILQMILTRTYGGMEKYADELRRDLDAVPDGAAQRISIHNKFLDGILRYGAEAEESPENIHELQAVMNELIEQHPVLKKLRDKIPNLAEELVGGTDD